MKRKVATTTSLQFFNKLKWLDGRNLLSTIEPYRRGIFTKALDTYRTDGTPQYNQVVAGRGKKNAKSLDLELGALFCTVIRRSVHGNEALILANDEGQAGDDLELIRKLVACNPELASEFDVLQKELRLKDGSGSIKILPAGDARGLHGKTCSFVGYDEIHGYRDWSVLEALQPDPTRRDTLVWITSYDVYAGERGVPLHDLKEIGFAGSDPRMLFSWYSADRCTDPNFAACDPEQRANPSMASWPEGRAYLEQQRRRLPPRFSRLGYHKGVEEIDAFMAGLDDGMLELRASVHLAAERLKICSEAFSKYHPARFLDPTVRDAAEPLKIAALLGVLLALDEERSQPPPVVQPPRRSPNANLSNANLPNHL